jgi:hypothetical protein
MEMDPECVALCDAINQIPGIETVESCCGHGEETFKVWFIVENMAKFPILLYYLDG